MEILKKWWVRFLISAFSVGAVSEVFNIFTGEGLLPGVFTVALFVLYFGLSIAYGLHLRKKDKLDEGNS